MSHKKYLISFFLGVLILYSVKHLMFYIVDPLQIFHPPWVRGEYFIRDLRVQAAGIIRHAEFDSIIIGTSHAANFYPKDAEKLWGGRFVNLAADASFLSERALILDFLFKHKKINNVIISMDGYAKIDEYSASYPVGSYRYLYNDYAFDDIKVYGGNKYLSYLTCDSKVFPSLKEHDVCLQLKPLDTLAEWASDKSHSERFGGINNWFSAKNNWQIQEAFKTIVENADRVQTSGVPQINETELARQELEDQACFDQYVMRFIKEHPGVQFYLYYPPYSRLNYAMWAQTNPTYYARYLAQLRYAVKKTSGHKNVSVYGFDELDFLDDIANYKDTIHYRPQLNVAMLEWMHGYKHRLNDRNIDDYIKYINYKAKAYNFIFIGNEIKTYLNRTNEK
ncbi:MAG: hypothetical protein H0W44_00515 [Gammaproteobacteria bacterium]|nr:hypothetical protein [Gammaproteobacteria bacterium]